MSKVGLVLEGGGMRGAYTAGVLSWFVRHNIEVDHVIGVSSGAMYGAFYLAKNEELMKLASIDVAPSKDNVGIRPLIREGQIVGYDHMYDHELFEMGFVPEDLSKSKSEFSLAVYDLENYQTIWKNKEEVIKEPKWIKAACSLPFYSRFVKIDGKKYTDGGVTTMIPLKRAIEVGCDKFIVVTTKSKDYVRPPFKKSTIWFLKHIMARKHTKMVEDFTSRTDVYYQERAAIDEQVEKGNALYLYPTKETGVSRFSGTREQFEDLFQMGVDDCESQKEQILQLLER